MQSAKIYLAEALIQMLETTPIDEISVKDLTARAGVSRMTYYRYFKEKKEILQFYMQYLLDGFLKEEATHPFIFQSYEHIYHSFKYFERYKLFAKVLLATGMESVMLDALNSYTSQLSSFKRNDPNTMFAFYFYAGALYNVYLKWVQEDTKTPPEELARIIYNTIKSYDKKDKI